MASVTALLIAAQSGCQGRARQDMYRAKMAHEIRVLEDELYEADYHNRVLIDKLEQIRLKSEPAPGSSTSPSKNFESIPTPSPSAASGDADQTPKPLADPVPNGDSGFTPPALPEFDAGEFDADLGGSDNSSPTTDDDTARGRDTGRSTVPADANDLGDLNSLFDDGQRVTPDEIEVPGDQAAGTGNRETQDPFEDDADADSTLGDADDDADGGMLLPAPGGPEPPGKSDTQIPPVLPGEVLPPSSTNELDDKPDGQIEIPDSALEGSGIPDQLRLHPSLSGGRRIDGSIANMMIVVNVLDRQGRPLELEKYDVDAELSIVIFDGDATADGQSEAAVAKPDEESRIGRWDFDATQVLDFVKSDPISGLHIPIKWQERQPKNDEVIVHIRLRSEEDEMRVEGRLKVDQANAVAEWTPRGDSQVPNSQSR